MLDTAIYGVRNIRMKWRYCWIKECGKKLRADGHFILMASVFLTTKVRSCALFRHLESYPTPRNINFFWNLGFLVALTMILQILTGILLGLHYTPHINSAYTTIMHILREVYFGWSFRSLHSSGASFLFFLLFFHLGRALYYGSSRLIPKVWFSGIFLFIFLMATAFLGYVLPWGQMSFWGATVITNLFSGVPCLVPWVCGGFLVSNPVAHSCDQKH